MSNHRIFRFINILNMKSIGKKLIFYFVIITVVPAVIISFFYYKVSQNNLEKNMLDSSGKELVYLMEMINKQLKNAEEFSDLIFVNRSFNHLLTRKYATQNVNYYDKEINDFRDFIDLQLLNNTSVGSYISSLIISGRNGFDMRARDDAALIDKIAIQKTDWFKEGIHQGGKVHWYGIIKNPALITHEDYILPLVRPILDYYSNRGIGWHMIGFRINLIADILKNYEINTDETILVVDSRGYCIYCHDKSLIGKDLNEFAYIRDTLQHEKQNCLRIQMNGGQRLAVFTKSRLTGWTIIKILSATKLNIQQKTLFNITLMILLFSFIFTSLLTIFLTNKLSFGLAKLLQQIQSIAAGNFNRNPSIEGEDELGILGRGINDMAVNIRSLLDQAIKDEQEKRRLELEMLQYQVNPHFLYNTLNSLKLMATIQKADGIKEMVTALGHLIMNLSKNNSDKITVAEEISLLNDYVYIQNIRYKGKIKMEYRLGNEELVRCKIIKFSLQPIVENAIFHGIEPKKDAGRITIDIFQGDGQLRVCIEDDGVGMTAEQITKVLSTPPFEKTRGLSGIGVKNVDERIKLAYGPEFGLSIESIPDQYTRVHLIIPLEI